MLKKCKITELPYTCSDLHETKKQKTKKEQKKPK